MKCTRCSAEIPGQAQFCMRCGTPVAAARSGGTVTMARPTGMSAAQTGPNKKLIAGITAALLLLLVAAFFGFRALTNRAGVAPGPSRVLEARGVTPTGGPLTERAGRVSNTGPLTTKPGVKTPAAPDPADVIDYLKFLKDIERQRVMLERQQVGQALKQSTALTGGNILGEMDEHPEQRHNQDYANFQKALNDMSAQWQALSQQFISKPAPQSCQQLQNKYYDLLGKTAAAVSSVGQSVSEAMSGNASKALDALSGQQGSGLGTPSKGVADACVAADDELSAVCDKFKLKKDFDIKDDGGGANLLGR